jgi:hypothetical protein
MSSGKPGAPSTPSAATILSARTMLACALTSWPSISAGHSTSMMVESNWLGGFAARYVAGIIQHSHWVSRTELPDLPGRIARGLNQRPPATSGNIRTNGQQPWQSKCLGWASERVAGNLANDWLNQKVRASEVNAVLPGLGWMGTSQAEPTDLSRNLEMFQIPRRHQDAHFAAMIYSKSFELSGTSQSPSRRQ